MEVVYFIIAIAGSIVMLAGGLAFILIALYAIKTTKEFADISNSARSFHKAMNELERALRSKNSNDT